MRAARCRASKTFSKRQLTLMGEGAEWDAMPQIGSAKHDVGGLAIKRCAGVGQSKVAEWPAWAAWLRLEHLHAIQEATHFRYLCMRAPCLATLSTCSAPALQCTRE